LVHEKGIDTLLEALAKMPECYQLAIAGQGSKQAELQKLAQRLGLAGRVHWLGYCGNMLNFYHAIDVLCMPSRQEGLPLALLEAQACGKTVVATHVGGIPDLICPQSGQLIPPEQPTLLAQALLDKLSQAHHYCQQTVEYIRKTADVRIMAASYESLAKQ
ncbi:glycosyltransferase, partial [Photobacterium sanctipauli]